MLNDIDTPNITRATDALTGFAGEVADHVDGMFDDVADHIVDIVAPAAEAVVDAVEELPTRRLVVGVVAVAIVVPLAWIAYLWWRDRRNAHTGADTGTAADSADGPTVSGGSPS